MTKRQINALLRKISKAKTDAEKERLVNQLDKQDTLSVLRDHLQTAVEIELATIPIYLFTYYSINRQPSLPATALSSDNPLPSPKRWEALKTFANKAGAVIMSVAVEEMLHMSLSSNVLYAVGGKPRLYGKSPWPFPTNLPHHKAGFEIGLSPFSSSQLAKFLWIENPEKVGAPAQGNNWATIGQFYDFIKLLINSKHLTDADFRQGPTDRQIQAENLPPNNTDTMYPKTATYAPQNGARVAQYTNAPDAHADYTNRPTPPPPGFPQSELVTINTRQLALEAVDTICEQGEGNTGDPRYDDKSHDEESHYWKFLELRSQLVPGAQDDPPPPPKHPPPPPKMPFTEKELQYILYPYPSSPITTAKYRQEYQAYSNLCNALYQYLLLMTEKTFQIPGEAQKAMFHIGMHKGMIFILDKVIGAMRYQTGAVRMRGGADAETLAPTFENFKFQSKKTAKRELITLFDNIPASQQPGGMLDRIKDLPDVNVGRDGYVSFTFADTLA